MRHGDVCWVRAGGDVVLARYTEYDDCDPYWAFFGSDYTMHPEELEVVSETDLRSE